MRYELAIDKLFALQARGVRMGVDRMHDALRFRHFDVASMPYVIVAGTNGKGSVSAMIAASLKAAGYRTGLFTSPHLHRFTERIRIDGRPIGTREAARRISDVLQAFGRPGTPQVTFFELSTLIAVEAFRDHACDIAVLEVGLGGRLDATNALPSVLGVITRIAFDHMNYLGNTLFEIASEKAGIVRQGVPVVVGTREPEALRAIRSVARRKRARALFIDRDFGAVLPAPRGKLFVRAPGQKLGPLTLALSGEHQHDNAACAVAALVLLRSAGFRIPDAALRRGLSRVRWPARLERIPGRPAFLLDAAHNPDGCAALALHLGALPAPSRSAPRRARRVLVFAVMRDKDYPAMLRTLGPLFDHVVYAPKFMPRAASVGELRRVQAGTAARSIESAMVRARALAGPDGLVVIAGSIFVVAQARALLLRLPSDPLIRM